MRPRVSDVFVRIASCSATALLLLCSSGPDVMCAAEERYSLGTIQQDEVLDIEAGEEVTTSVGLYNVDGTLPVQVDMTVLDVPDGLDVRLLPRCHDAGIVTVESESKISLHVAPMDLHEDMPSCEDPCTDAWWLPERGYVCAIAVDVLVRAPDNHTTGGGPLTVSVIGSWESSPGAIPQERELVYDIVVEPVESDRTTYFAPVLIGTIGLCILIAGLTRHRVAKSPPL
ncbi:MAG: hypothetical protein ACOC9B_03410 [Chloroflexota bacterium]